MPPILCEDCHRSFSRRDALKRHMETVHGNTSSSNLNPRETAINQAMMPCTLCDLVVRNKNMMEHKKRFHSTWVGPYCEDVKQVPNPLHAHKPKKCEQCGQFFLYDNNLYVHLFKHGLNASEMKAAVQAAKQRAENTEHQPEYNQNQVNESVQDELVLQHETPTENAFESQPKRRRLDPEQELRALDLENIRWSQYNFDTEEKSDMINTNTLTTPHNEQVQHNPNEQISSNNNEVNIDGASSYDTDNENYCKHCKTTVISWERHVLTYEHKNNAQIRHSDGVTALDIAFKARIIGYRIYNLDSSNLDYKEFLNSNHVMTNLINLLSSYLRLHTAIKFQLMLYGQYVKQNSDPEEQEIEEKRAVFQTSMTELFQNNTITDVLSPLIDQLIEQTEEFTTKGSGWALTKISFVELHINKYSPLRCGSHIKTPNFIYHKHACFNPNNDDDHCFQWAIRGWLRYQQLCDEHPYALRQMPGIRKTIYQQVTKMSQEVARTIDADNHLNWSGLDNPIKMNQINDFLANNPTFSVTLYGLAPDESKTIVGPLFKSDIIKENHIHLLLLEEGGRNHILIIHDIMRLLGKQIGGRQIHHEFCEGCLSIFNSYQQLVDHQENDCLGIATYLPPAGTKMKFENFAHKIMQPLVCYADFEAVLVPVEGCANLPELTRTERKYQHVPSSYSFLIKYAGDSTKDYLETYRGEDCTEKFIGNLYSKLKSMYEDLVLNNVHPMIFTRADMIIFDQQTHCHICEKQITGKKVRDHDHLTGKFRGAACDECNKKFYLTKEVSVFFHNLSKYDAHLFIEDLAKLKSDRNIEIIPCTDETYISFMKPIEVRKNRNSNDDETNHDKIFLKVKFKDSYRFFPGSLEAQALNLTREQYNNLEAFLSPKFNNETVDLLKRKGIFPYQYIDSFGKYDETNLPSKEQFGDISDANYEHAKKVFEMTRCRNIGDYSDLYVTTDVLILADVFENFRSICLNPDNYGLDPVHYYTLPGFSWDAMLKHTRVELELLSDLKMINFFNNGIRGGVNQCSFRYAKANNKYMSQVDEEVEKSYLMYMDVNNLYGWAMVHSLPVGEFEWLTTEEITSLEHEIHNLHDDAYHGYVLEVDLDYPDELHNDHNDLPFCPVKKKFGSTTKLCTTLEPKKNYVIHYRSLKQALENGLKLKKIHRVLRFHQTKWLAPYINFNTEMRAKATTPAEKDLFKLMNNSIFGKAIENILKRRNIYLCNSWSSVGQKKGAEGYIASGYLKHVKVFNENLVAVELAKKSVKFCKPMYVGFCVLEQSKLRMYDFHYNVMKPKFSEPNQLQLCYMDTDSFVYYIKTDDFYKDFKEIVHQNYTKADDIHRIDTSNYPLPNRYGYQSVNKKVLGAMKDECAGIPMTLFIGLRSKAYYYEVDGKGGTNKAKGVVRKVAQTLTKDNYMHCLHDLQAKVRKTMTVFRSDNHRIYTETIRKIALNAADDKRVISETDGISTYAYGHIDLQVDEFINGELNAIIEETDNISI